MSLNPSYEIQRPTAKITKDIFLPEFPDINFKHKTLIFINSSDNSYIFKLEKIYKNKIIILKQDSFIWNRYP